MWQNTEVESLVRKLALALVNLQKEECFKMFKKCLNFKKETFKNLHQFPELNLCENCKCFRVYVEKLIVF